MPCDGILFFQPVQKGVRKIPHELSGSGEGGKAQELIASTEYKLVQIAEAVGYDDYQYFTKVFKKISGVTPGEYKAGIAREIEDEDGTDT